MPARRTALRTRQSRSSGGSGEEQRMGWRMGLAGLHGDVGAPDDVAARDWLEGGGGHVRRREEEEARVRPLISEGCTYL